MKEIPLKVIIKKDEVVKIPLMSGQYLRNKSYAYMGILIIDKPLAEHCYKKYLGYAPHATLESHSVFVWMPQFHVIKGYKTAAIMGKTWEQISFPDIQSAVSHWKSNLQLKKEE